MRKRIYEIISASNGRDKLSSIYDIFMMAVIVISLVPLVFKQSFEAFDIADKICAGIFIIDYILRWVTADYKFQKHSTTAFLRYPYALWYNSYKSEFRQK